MKIVAKRDTESRYGVKIPEGTVLEVNEDYLTHPDYPEEYVAYRDDFNHGNEVIVRHKDFDIYVEDAEIIEEMVERLGKGTVQGLLDAAPEKNYQVEDLVPAGTRLPFAWFGERADGGAAFLRLYLPAKTTSATDRKILWREED